MFFPQVGMANRGCWIPDPNKPCRFRSPARKVTQIQTSTANPLAFPDSEEVFNSYDAKSVWNPKNRKLKPLFPSFSSENSRSQKTIHSAATAPSFCSSLWRSEQRCPDPFYPECQKATSGRQSWQLEYRFPSRNMNNCFLTMPRINFGFDLNTNKRVYVKFCPLDVFCFSVPRQPSNRSKHLQSRVEIPETSLEIRWN